MKHLGKRGAARLTFGPVVLLATTLGCDDGAATVAREAADRQADQNRTMAELHQEVAAGARQLVEQEGQARQDALEVHRDLAAGQARLAAGWDAVAAERRELAAAQRSDSFWTALLPPSAGVVAVIAALAFAWVLLHSVRASDDASVIACELLSAQLDGCVSLPPRAALSPSDASGAGLLTSGGPVDCSTDIPPEEKT